MEKNLYRYINEKDLNDYEKETGYLSYKHLFYNDDSIILCNNIAERYGYQMEIVSGSDYDGESDEYIDIYQYYIIEDDTARRLMENTNEIIFYDNELDLYILGVTHFGTSWSYVLTDLKLEKQEEEGATWYNVYKIEEDESETKK